MADSASGFGWLASFLGVCFLCVGWYNTEFRDFVVGLIWCGSCFLGFVGFLDLLLAVWFGDLFPRRWFGVDCWCCACLDWLLSWVCCACFGFVRLGFRFDYGLRCGFWICCGFYFVVFGFWLRLLLFGVVVVFLVLRVCCGRCFGLLRTFYCGLCYSRFCGFSVWGWF